MPLSSTRICPYFALLATAIFSPVAASLGDGLEATVEGLDPHAALSNEKTDMAPATNILACMHPDTEPGYGLPVTHRKGLAQHSVDQSPRPADIDHRRLGVEDDAHDAAVAGDPLHCGRGERHRELHLPGGRSTDAFKGLHRGRHLEFRRLTSAGNVDERIRITLVAGPVVVLSGGLGQRLERSADSRSADRIGKTAYQQASVLSRVQAQAALFRPP